MTTPNHPVFSNIGVSIFNVMSVLAVQHGALNLGQGFPDEDGPLWLRERAARVLIDGPNQYPPSRGILPLRAAIAAHARRFYGLDFDPETQVLVTSGATESLAAAILALNPPGGEMLLIEPAYDAYRPLAQAAGVTVNALVLQPPDWRLTEAALRAAITPKTRTLLVNSPLNPLGRVFDESERAAIARVAIEHDLIVICDEAYEHLTYGDARHVPLIAMPGMAERCVRIGSAGKIFSFTGWKIGWTCGPADLVRLVFNAHQFLTFTVPPALQIAVAEGLERGMDFSLDLARALQSKRDRMAEGLAKLGLKPGASEGTYFITADISPVTPERDDAFCHRLVTEGGVALIPMSGFFSNNGPGNFVRVAFCKKQDVLDEALARLGRFLNRA